MLVLLCALTSVDFYRSFSFVLLRESQRKLMMQQNLGGGIQRKSGGPGVFGSYDRPSVGRRSREYYAMDDDDFPKREMIAANEDNFHIFRKMKGMSTINETFNETVVSNMTQKTRLLSKLLGDASPNAAS